MSGNVVVDNNTGRAIHTNDCVRGPLFGVLLASSTYHPQVMAPSVACARTRTIPAGKSSYPVTIQASYSACNMSGVPACLPGNPPLPPGLPPGTYHTMLFQPGHVAPAPPAITVRVTPVKAGTSGYSVPLRRIVADANAQNHGNPSYRLAAPGTKVPMPEATAARAVISTCNEGRGTRVLAAGLVTGPVTSGSSLYWAVFVDPPGKHIASSAQSGGKPVILNWIGAFVSVKTTQQPFCDFGHAANLPPLPIFGS